MVSEIPGMPGMVEVSDEERALVEWAKGDIRPNFDHPSTLHGRKRPSPAASCWRRASEIIREALAAYLANHRAS